MSNKAEQIVAVSIALLAREGLGVPTARIAREAGVANGTLFNVFPTKQDLLDRIYLDIKREVAGLFAGAVGDEVAAIDAFLADVWRLYILWAMANPEKHRVMHLLKGGDAVSPVARAEAEAPFAAGVSVVGRLVEAGFIGEADFPLMMKLAEAQMTAVVEYVNERRLAENDIERLIAWSYRVFCTGIQP